MNVRRAWTAFPWDLLKIDKSFVQALETPNHNAELVVSSTIALAHALGIPTTAEGVETTEQLHRLAQLGCDNAQGYLFARPSSARDAITHVTADAQWTGPGTPVAHGTTTTHLSADPATTHRNHLQ